MKPLHPIEQIALTLSLAVVCAMATTRCSHAQPINNEYSIDKYDSTAGDASEYASFAHPHDEFGLVTNDNLAQMPRSNHAALFCVSSCTSVMVRLDGEAFAPASFLDYLLTNPVQSNRLRLVTNDSTSINNLGVNHD